jgi:hypothetical protein
MKKSSFLAAIALCVMGAFVSSLGTACAEKHTFWKNGARIPAWFPATAFGASGPFYQRLPADPRIDGNSDAVISYYFAGNDAEFDAGRIDADKNQAKYDYSFPVYIASRDDPLVTIDCDHRSPAPCSDGGAHIRVPALAHQAGGEDHHLAVVQPDGTEYDFWLVSSRPPYRNGSRFSAAGEGHYRLKGKERSSNYVSPGFDVGSATAGGIALSIGQIYTTELAAGVINHAIALTFPCGTDAWVYPASQTTGTCADGQGMPLGSRVWWRPTEKQTRAMSLPRDAETILIAMHRYGGFFTDNGEGTKDINGRAGGMGAHIENQEPYWIYGKGFDPAADYAAKAPGWNRVRTFTGVDRYVLAVPGSSADFLDNLKVLAPCVTRHTC